MVTQRWLMWRAVFLRWGNAPGMALPDRTVNHWKMLSSPARIGLGLGNALLAVACVPLTVVVGLFAMGPFAPGAPEVPHAGLRFAISQLVWLGVIALFTRAAVVALRDREWRPGVQAAPFATAALLAILLEIADRLW